MSKHDLSNKEYSKNPRGQFLVYKTEDGHVKIETRLQDETIWLSINQMAELFSVDKSGISRHLKNIFESGIFFQIKLLGCLKH